MVANDESGENNASPVSNRLQDEELATDEETDQYIAEVAGYDKWPRDVSIDFDGALGLATVKSFRVDFASAVEEYRAIETEYLARIGNDEENAQQVRRHIIEMLLRTAIDKKEPFDTCQKLWNELLHLGFYRIERECRNTWYFGHGCRKHRQTEIGLGVLAPLIAKLERLLADPTVTKPAADYYEHELDGLEKLRAELEALRT